MIVMKSPLNVKKVKLIRKPVRTVSPGAWCQSAIPASEGKDARRSDFPPYYRLSDYSGRSLRRKCTNVPAKIIW